MRKRILILIIICFGKANITTASYTDSLLKVISKTKEDTTRINCWNTLSYHYSDDDSTKTRLYASYALQLAKKAKFTKGICQAYSNLAYYFEAHKYDFATAKKYTLAGIQVARKGNNLSLEGAGLMDLATVLKKQKKHEQVLEIDKKVVEIFSQLQDTAKLIIAYNDLGNAYKNLNQFDKSIAALLQSLELAKTSNNQNQIARAYINIGVCYDGNGDYNLALSNYLAAIEPAQAGGNKNYIASNYGNIGSAYINLNEFEKAIFYLQKAMAIHESENEEREVAFILNNLATVNNSLKNYTTAIKNSIRCIQIAQQTNDIELEAYGYLYLGVSYQGLENYNLAKVNFLKAQQQIEQVNNTAYTMQVYASLADYYSANKDYKNAFNYYHKLIAMRDTIFNSEKHLQIATLQTQYQTAEKENELAKSKSQNLQNDLLLQKKNNLLLLSALGLLLLAFIAILISRNARLRNAKLRQEKEIERIKASQKLQEEKLRISRELHDNIGSQLTFINTSLQQLDPVKADAIQISETQKMAINTIRELRSIVWLINKDEFMIEEMVIKLRDFMKPLQLIKPLVDISIIGNEELKLSAPIASNIFRIIQEASNNTIKYADANKLTICFDTAEIGKLKLTIKDDGKGFAVDSINQFSFGLKNMNARAKEINATFQLKSSIGEGTEIVLSIPLSD